MLACREPRKGRVCVHNNPPTRTSSYLEQRVDGARTGPVARLFARLFAGSLRCPQASHVHHLLDKQLHLKGDDRVLHLATLQEGGGGGRQT